MEKNEKQNTSKVSQETFDKEIKKAGGVFSLIVKLKNGNYELK